MGILVAVVLSAVAFQLTDALKAPSVPLIRPGLQERDDGSDDNSTFQWPNVVPSPSLQYVPCYDGFQCARLQVPLDWNNTDPSFVDSVSIAVLRIPAQVPITDPRYGGPVLINPGGPGGFGVNFGVQDGQAIQTMLDAAYINNSTTYVVNSTDAKYFDIIAFDPRAVGNTTPYLACGSDAADMFDLGQQSQHSVPGTLEGPPELLWSLSSALNDNCFTGLAISPNGSRIADFIGTTDVARDMVEIVERHGEWLEKQTNGSIKWQKGEEPLQYYGDSYGTILGAVFAAMQPHRVKRLLLDGVSSSSQYFAGEITSDIQQADLLFEHLFEYCALAGSDVCPLWTGNSSADIKNHLQAIFDDIEHNGPVIVTLPTGPQVITLSDIKLITLETLYNPLQSFPLFAEVMAPLAERNGTNAAIYKAQIRQTQPQWELDPYNSSTNPNLAHITTAILGCDTGLKLDNVTAWDPVWRGAEKASYWVGDAIAGNYMGQFNWPSRPKWRFADDHPIASNVTANPILFASNLVDGVTSLESAQGMVAAFEGSGLLTVDGEGHCSTSSPSMCIGQKMRYYFQTGKLPDGLDKPCLPYARPFLGLNASDVAPFDPTGASLEEYALYNATLTLAG